MSPSMIGIAGMILVLVLMSQRVPVALAMMAVGVVGIAMLNSVPAALSTFVTESWHTATFFELTVIPFFVLMGNIASLSGMSRNLYDAGNVWVGHFRGGLAHATVLGCTGFAALSGSSVASAITIGRVALPEMARFGYDRKLAAGAVAAGGTLGILIPPSTGFVIYAILTEESIGRLFLAGILPGLLLCGAFMAAIFLRTSANPSLGPAAERAHWPERFGALWRAVPILLVIVISIGGIYAGVFTPVEASAVGAMLVFLFSLSKGRAVFGLIPTALLHTVSTTVMIYFILIGANVFGPFLALTHIPGDLADMLNGLDIPPVALLALILLAFIVLGTFLDGFAIMVLVLPIVLPIIEQSGIPALVGLSPESSDFRVWFGVIMVVILEMALISPPVGMNVFVVKGVAKDMSMRDIYAGILPFWLAMIAILVVLIAFPTISLLLPRTMLQ